MTTIGTEELRPLTVVARLANKRDVAYQAVPHDPATGAGRPLGPAPVA